MKAKMFICITANTIFSFFTNFIAIPLVMTGSPDFLWMAAMLLLPAIIAWLFYEKIARPAPGWLLAGMAVEYVLLVVLAGPVSRLFGTSIEHSLGWFSYIGSAFPWPLVVTLVQFLLMLCIRKASPEVSHE